MADEKKAIPCKVVLIGESGVGKTSIISRYMTDSFSSTLGSTPGANFTTKTVFLKNENQSIKFEIWDTAGQEKFRSLAKVFYKNAAICILVYEITRRASFEELKKYWIEEVKNNGAKNISKLNLIISNFFKYIVLAIAANKSDMYEFEEVTEAEGIALARQINAIFQSTSAKDQNGSIDKLFQNLGRKFLHPNSDIGNDFGNNSKNRGTQLSSKSGGKEKKGCC
jgi:small GTP-binding protein